MDQSMGFHMLEVHMLTAGSAAFIAIMVIVAIVAAWYCLRRTRCVAGPDNSNARQPGPPSGTPSSPQPSARAMTTMTTAAGIEACADVLAFRRLMTDHPWRWSSPQLLPPPSPQQQAPQWCPRIVTLSEPGSGGSPPEERVILRPSEARGRRPHPHKPQRRSSEDEERPPLPSRYQDLRNQVARP